MSAPLRIVFMGSPPFVFAPLEKLHASAHELVAVYCPPPEPAGRGMKLRKTAVHNWADEHGIPVHTPETLKSPEAVAELAALKPDVAIVASYGKILPQTILDVPRYGCINIHPSLLPRWRGATPVPRTLLHGDAETGVCVMQMGAGMDSGPLWLTAKCPTPNVNALQLLELLFGMGAELLLQAIDKAVAGETPTPQPSEGMTHAPKIDKAELQLNLNDSALRLDCRIRAFTPWPGVWFESNGQRVKVHEAVIGNPTTQPARTLLDASGLIACGEGTSLQLVTVQREGKQRQDAASFLRGHNIKVGDAL